MTKQKQNEVNEYENFQNLNINKVKAVLRGALSGTDYLRQIKNDNSSDQPELSWIRKDMGKLREFLLEFSEEERCDVLLHKEIIGFSRNELSGLYGVHKDLIGRLVGQYVTRPKKSPKKPPKSPKVFDILAGPYVFNTKFIAFIAVLARVPYTWLVYRKPSRVWDDNHFINLSDFLISEGKLEEVISQLVGKGDLPHHVWPLIVRCDDGLELFLRVEILNGTFMVELFNASNQLFGIVKLNKLLLSRHPHAGYMETVISHHYNYCLLGQNWPIKHIPPEFKLLDF